MLFANDACAKAEVLPCGRRIWMRKDQGTIARPANPRGRIVVDRVASSVQTGLVRVKSRVLATESMKVMVDVSAFVPLMNRSEDIFL
jgi:hypothetical protein